MKFKIIDIDFSWNFNKCYRYSIGLLELYELESVSFRFNGVVLKVYNDTIEKELFKYYRHNVK